MYKKKKNYSFLKEQLTQYRSPTQTKAQVNVQSNGNYGSLCQRKNFSGYWEGLGAERRARESEKNGQKTSSISKIDLKSSIPEHLAKIFCLPKVMLVQSLCIYIVNYISELSTLKPAQHTSHQNAVVVSPANSSALCLNAASKTALACLWGWQGVQNRHTWHGCKKIATWMWQRGRKISLRKAELWEESQEEYFRMSDHPKVLDTMKKTHLLLCPNKQDFLHKSTKCLRGSISSCKHSSSIWKTPRSRQDKCSPTAYPVKGYQIFPNIILNYLKLQGRL